MNKYSYLEQDEFDGEEEYLAIRAKHQLLVLDIRGTDQCDAIHYLETLHDKHGDLVVLDKADDLEDLREAYPNAVLRIGNCHPQVLGEHMYSTRVCNNCQTEFCRACSRDAREQGINNISNQYTICPWCGEDRYAE